MRIAYTAAALRQLDEVLTYIGERSPQGAQSVKARLQTTISLLVEYPLIGSTTDRPGLRRLSLRPYPYAVFYRVSGDTVTIQRIRHAARRPISSRFPGMPASRPTAKLSTPTALKAAGSTDETIRREAISGARSHRAQLARLLDQSDSGDVLIVTRLTASAGSPGACCESPCVDGQRSS